MRLIQGDCLKVLAEMAENSIDSIVTDPPYGLVFMGKQWDCSVPSVEIWRQCLRVLKPGGHLLAFAGTRTQHRMAVNIEAAGFEIRDMVAWVYGQGYPKSLDVSKALDKQAGAERKVVGKSTTGPACSGFEAKGRGNIKPAGKRLPEFDITAPATDAARQWQGWGTALKPALEPVTVARKPLTGTVAENVQQWGTGALNIDECRIFATDNYSNNNVVQGVNTRKTSFEPRIMSRIFQPSPSGRWPANLIHDGSDEVMESFPVLHGAGAARAGSQNPRDSKHEPNAYKLPASTGNMFRYGDSGSAARFFYCAKASKSERGEGNTHPTVKPVALMRYLCRLVTPPGGTVLDPFMGSGTTGIAAKAEGFSFVGIEREAAYFEIAKTRIEQSTNAHEHLSDESQLEMFQSGEE